MVLLYMVGMYPTTGTSQSWMAVGRPPTLTITIPMTHLQTSPIGEIGSDRNDRRNQKCGWRTQK